MILWIQSKKRLHLQRLKTWMRLCKTRPYRLIVSTCYDYGVVRISVNGRVVEERLDLHSSNLELREVDLGVVRPVDNTITIRIELVEPNPRSRGSRTYAGIDYLLAASENLSLRT